MIHRCPICRTEWSLDGPGPVEVVEKVVFESLPVIGIYTKPKHGAEPDFEYDTDMRDTEDPDDIQDTWYICSSCLKHVDRDVVIKYAISVTYGDDWND